MDAVSSTLVRAVLGSDITPSGCRLVALVLAWHFNDEKGCAWPGMSTIAAEAGVTRDRVKQVLRELQAAGVIEVESGAGGAGAAATSRYRFAEAWVGKWATRVAGFPGKPTTQHPVSRLPQVGEPAYPEKDERDAKRPLSSKSSRPSASPARFAAGGRGGAKRQRVFPADYYVESSHEE